MEKKIRKLEDLKEEIVKETKEEVWFYSMEYREYKIPASRHGIKGWLGTQDIFFVGPNPSKNPRKDSPGLNFFFKELKTNGFENAHLTDLVKIRLFNKDVKDKLNDENIINKQLEFLRKEFDIIKPKLIVILGACTGWKGKKIKEILKENFRNTKIKDIYHYSSIRFRFPKNKIKFIKDMKDVKKWYRNK